MLFVGAGLVVTASAEPQALQAVLRCSASSPVVAVGGNVEMTCSLIDNLGQPVYDTDITFYVNFENRADAFMDNGRKSVIKRTDTAGIAKATINAGNQAGNFGLLVNLPGIYSSFTFIRIEPAPAPVVPLLPAPEPEAEAS
jgi:hypothetical protein